MPGGVSDEILSLLRVHTVSGVHPDSYPKDTLDSTRVERPGREAACSPPCSTEVKIAWSYTSTPPICLHA
jgi:hypothetical protein